MCFRLLSTNSVRVNAENEKFTGMGSRCQNLKDKNFMSSFGRLRQKIALKSLPHVHHHYNIFPHLTNQIIDLWGCRCGCHFLNSPIISNDCGDRGYPDVHMERRLKMTLDRDQYTCKNPSESAPAENKRIFEVAILVSFTEKISVHFAKTTQTPNLIEIRKLSPLSNAIKNKGV